MCFTIISNFHQAHFFLFYIWQINQAEFLVMNMARIGVLEKVDDKHVRFVTTLPSKGANSPDDVIRVLSNNMNRLFHTLSHNMNIEKKSDGMLQLEYWSNGIDPEDYQEFIKRSNDSARKFMQENQKNVEYFEIKAKQRAADRVKSNMSKNGYNMTQDEVKPDTEPKRIEIGVSVFIFKNET